ncbi:MAG: DoxX family protein [Gammaproteobacteria bacterium]|nr:DoxX family protein [Gammaproteobacteria bacterium]
MNKIIEIVSYMQNMLNKTRHFDFLGPLLLRLYLVPVFWIAGMNKLNGFDNVVEWFGNSEWGLGLPMPWIMAALATGAEVVGAVLLLIGFAVRWISIPLMFTMIIAAVTVHLKNGWQAVADINSPFPSADIDQAIEKLSMAKSLLREHGNYDWLTSSGNFVISNSGIEWAATYFIMLLALFFIGAGKYVSVDYWLKKSFDKSGTS